jgi:glycosyltransferase involved in cell wall biosynthesis
MPAGRGWARYTANLASALAAAGVDVVLYADRPLAPHVAPRLARGGCRIQVAPPMRHPVFEQRWLPRRSREDAVDVFHTPFTLGMPWQTPCARVLTLHDAIDHVLRRRRGVRAADAHPRAVVSRLYAWIARTRAHRVITVSEHARRDLIDHLRIDERRIAVIHEAADPIFEAPIAEADRAAVRRRHALSRPYVLYVGGWEARKNVGFLLQAFAAARLAGLDLVLAGGSFDEIPLMRRLAESAGVAGAVRLLGRIEDSELPALYAEALAFVYPSAYEGFGLQLCEAMTVGCPVLAARASSLPEILGSGGETFALDGQDELVGLLRRVVLDAAVRAALSARARARASAFSWRRTAELTLDVYRDAIARTRDR